MQTLILFNYFKLLLLKLTLFYPKKTSYFRLEFFVMSGLMHYSSLTQKQPPSFTKISSNHEEVQKMEDQQSYLLLFNNAGQIKFLSVLKLCWSFGLHNLRLSKYLAPEAIYVHHISMCYSEVHQTIINSKIKTKIWVSSNK